MIGQKRAGFYLSCAGRAPAFAQPEHDVNMLPKAHVAQKRSGRSRPHRWGIKGRKDRQSPAAVRWRPGAYPNIIGSMKLRVTPITTHSAMSTKAALKISARQPRASFLALGKPYRSSFILLVFMLHLQWAHVAPGAPAQSAPAGQSHLWRPRGLCRSYHKAKALLAVLVNLPDVGLARPLKALGKMRLALCDELGRRFTFRGLHRSLQLPGGLTRSLPGGALAGGGRGQNERHQRKRLKCLSRLHQPHHQTLRLARCVGRAPKRAPCIKHS